MKPLKITAALLAAALGGCASAPTPVTQRVEVPVPVPCVNADAVPVKPVYQFDKLPATASDGAQVIALANDWLVGRKYEGQLEAVIAGCR
jgi:hypothetical protein